MRERSTPGVIGYLVAVVVTAVAVAARWLIDPWLGAGLALVTLFPAVAIALWVGGYRPALLATAVGYLACDYLFIARGVFDLPDTSRLVGSIAYLFSCSILIGFGEVMRRTRARAHEQQESLRITVASIGDAVISVDTDGRITQLNPVAASLTGWTAAEAAEKPLDAVFRLVDEQTQQGVESPARRALREGTAVGPANHSVLVAKDGTVRPIDHSAAPIRDGNGRVAGCVLVFRDVTERRRAEQVIQRSERDLSDLFENATVAVHWVGPDGVILRANQAELDLLGYSREEYVGRHLAEFHADAPVIDDILDRLASGGAVREQPARLRCKDGSVKDVMISSSALFEDGRFVHTRCFTVDVTERKRAEETREVLAAIVETSDDAMVSKTLEGIIRSWNGAAERLFGYTAEQAVGKSIDLIIPRELRREERTILERLRRGERIHHFETVRVAKDGRRIDISLSVAPLRDGSGRIFGASKVARDITERKRTEKALRDADRRKTEFLAVLAHELRNPLAPIRNSLEIIKRAEDHPERVRRAREMIDRQLSHMVRLVDDLLDVSRLTRDGLELRKTRVELAPILHQTLESCRPLVDALDQTVEVALPEQPVYLDADPIRLAQVFSNLLNNASKYTQRGGTIRLTAERQASEVRVSVEDDGIGIGPDEIERIFEMFEQADPTLERSRGGLGIGLTLAKQLVELHEGSIAARSEGVGLGSEFVVCLPVLVEARDVRPSAAALDGEPAPPRRILVVDDNEDSAESLAMLLRMNGHETQLAHDGLEAVGAADRFRPDVVLLDLGLPKLDGFEVCRAIRERPWGRNLVIVALTGWGQDEDRRRSKAAGFDGHLVKPVDLADLMRLLAMARAAHGAT